MTATFNVLREATRSNWRRLLWWGVGFVVLSQVLMMIALVVRFGAIPNYITYYDWIGNVAWIIQSTPSWRDIPPIIAEEWLIEIGFMNYDYGNGISEWSLNVVPSRLVVMFGLGALVGLCDTLNRARTCALEAKRGLSAATGFGTVLVAMTNATMSWVVCCATPSWVVGLAMLGLGVSTSLALETLGPLLAGSGFAILCALTLYLAWSQTKTGHPSGVLQNA